MSRRLGTPSGMSAGVCCVFCGTKHREDTNIMKKFLAIMALALPMLATPVVTYTTTGTFTPGGTDTVAAGGGTLTYLSGGGSVDLGTINPSNATFGTFNTLGFSSVADLA